MASHGMLHNPSVVRVATNRGPHDVGSHGLERDNLKGRGQRARSVPFRAPGTYALWDASTPVVGMPRTKRRATPAARRAGGGGRTNRTGDRPGAFVGRDPSPVLDRYPPRNDAPPAPPPVVVSSSAAPTSPPTPSRDTPLITLERGFDLDQFSSLLGETSIRVVVPRDDLLEVLRRVMEFMGFGVYVYSFSVRPGTSDLLKEFVVELRRVDFSAANSAWKPFEERTSPSS